MKISSGPYDIYQSGSVISYEHQSVTFHIDDLIFRVTFKDDNEKNGKHLIEYNSISDKELEIILVNFNNPTGTGNITPLDLGRLNGRKLYLNIRVAILNSSANKTIDYTWYLGEEVTNG